MKTLWAPWRLTFVTKEKSGECIFCAKPTENADKKNYIYERRELVFGVLNRFPYNSGHLMIAPYRHVVSFADLRDDEWRGILELLRDTMKVLNDLMHPEGFNLGFNVGKASGAGYEHLHLHVVPRWSGDTNFMPVLSDTKVIPEHLEETFRRIRDSFRSPRR